MAPVLPLSCLASDRDEPRVNKRRPKVLALMTLPRSQYRAAVVVAA